MSEDLKMVRNVGIMAHIELVKQQRQNVFFLYWKNHKIGEFMMALLLWIGWYKNKNVHNHY
jgi:adenosylmethionine-8-amino-7-oxononanoate aminotransferase